MSDVWRERGARLWLVGRTFEQDMNDPLGDLPVNVDVHAHLKWLETGKGDPFPKAGESFEEAVHDGIWRRSLLHKLVCPLIGDIGIEQLGRNEIGFVLERVIESGRPPSVVPERFLRPERSRSVGHRAAHTQGTVASQQNGQAHVAARSVRVDQAQESA